jgi:flagellar biosynthetic protein FliO
MMLALGVVLAIMWLIAKWLRKPLTGKSDQVLSVLARQQLSRGASVAVIKVADRALVLGVTEQGVRLLSETDLSLIEDSLAVLEAAPSRRGRRSAGTDWDAELALATAEDEPSTDVAETAERVSHRAAKPAARARPAVPARKGPLDGSVLSPAMWKQLMQGARDLTVRK